MLKNDDGKDTSVSCERDGSLFVSVRDTGAGMTKDQLKKLFHAGTQFNVNELQNGKGSGLGLYIAKGIVEQHNGTLGADSEGLGLGTTFTLELPLHDVPRIDTSGVCVQRPKIADWDSTTITTSTTNMDAENSTSSSRIDICAPMEVDPLRILVVDDAPSVRKLLCRLLEKRGHICVQAQDGKEAVEKVKQSIKGTEYDAVLLDYEMPELNGPEAAKLIRENLRSDVFIVGITGNLLEEDVNYFLSCGANAVLPKPLNIHDLEVVLSNHGIVSSSSIGPSLS